MGFTLVAGVKRQAPAGGWTKHLFYDMGDGSHVSEVDHAFIRSCYTYDPDGNWVEWTYDTRLLGAADRTEAEVILADDTPASQAEYEGCFTRSAAKKRVFPGRKPLFPG